MPINHRFLEHDFGNQFQTHNAILDKVPYEPEVLILGTYNPETKYPGADFFYGRKSSWFWVVMKNIFINGAANQQLIKRVCNRNGQLINPTLPEIQSLSVKIKITFADLIKQTMHNGNPKYILHDNQPNPKDIITYHGTNYNLISDNDLSALNDLGQVNWGTKDVIKYIQQTPSIKCVRFTRNPDGVWLHQWNQIVLANYTGRVIDFGRIHTPAGVGLAELGINPAIALARRWLWHNDKKRRFCDDWVIRQGVDRNSFNYPEHPHRLNG